MTLVARTGGLGKRWRLRRILFGWGFGLVFVASLGSVVADFYQSTRQKWLTDSSTAVLVAAAQRCPNDSDLLYTAALRLWQREGRAAEAAPLAQQALKLEPRQAKNHLLVGYLEAASKRPANALRRYEEAVRLAPKLTIAHKSAGDIYRAAGMAERAITHFEGAWNLARPDISARGGLIAALCDARQFQRAETLCREVIPYAPPTEVETFRLLHRACAGAGRGLSAERTLREHINRHQIILNGTFWSELAREVLENRPGEDGLRLGETYARKGVSKSPETPVCEEMLGLVLERQERLDQAVASYRRALSLAPKSYRIRMALARCLRGQGKSEAASGYEPAPPTAESLKRLALLRQHHDAHPDDQETRVALAEALEMAGEPAAAFREVWALVEADPRDTRRLAVANKALVAVLQREGD